MEEKEKKDRIFILIATSDRIVFKEFAFMYGLNAMKYHWMDQVRIVFWGPSQTTVVEDEEIQAKIKEMQAAGVTFHACKACADDLGISDKLSALNVKTEYIGTFLTGMLKTGWYQLTV